MEYEKPLCSQKRQDGTPCKYEPVNKCRMCGELICIAHSEEFKTPNRGWEKTYDGIYCPDCFAQVIQEHDAHADKTSKARKKEQAAQTACDITKCGCDCTERFCKEVMKP